MAEDIKGLIEKIQEEGVEAGRKKAARIEEEAHEKAAEILAAAQRRAEETVEKAGREATRLRESAEASLKQAGRDLLISLRQEINRKLKNLVLSSVRESLSGESLAAAIAGLIKTSSAGEDILVSLSEEDAKKLAGTFAAQLRDEVKKGVKISGSKDIAAGFTISFDSGKSFFDFTDQALAGYLTQHLNPKISEILT